MSIFIELTTRSGNGMSVSVGICVIVGDAVGGGDSVIREQPEKTITDSAIVIRKGIE
jgi:hypothetical protein